MVRGRAGDVRQTMRNVANENVGMLALWFEKDVNCSKDFLSLETAFSSSVLMGFA